MAVTDEDQKYGQRRSQLGNSHEALHWFRQIMPVIHSLGASRTGFVIINKKSREDQTAGAFRVKVCGLSHHKLVWYIDSVINCMSLNPTNRFQLDPPGLQW